MNCEICGIPTNHYVKEIQMHLCIECEFEMNEYIESLEEMKEVN